MRNFVALLATASLAIALTPALASAQASEPLKPYVVFAFDTSGSMASSTGSGPPSCGGSDTRLDHARCAINKIVNSYGDMVFALAHFRSTKGGTVNGTFPSGCCWNGPDVGFGGGCSSGPTCNASADMFEMVTALVEGQNAAAASWVDFSGNTCTTGSNPEIWAASGNTPLEGTLRGAKQYWSGLQAPNYTIWPSGSSGFSPIANDPTRTSFLPTGCDPSPGCTTNCCVEQCRPYITILMTDGEETCGGTPANAATSLLATDVGGRRYRVETKVIGFGIEPGDPGVEAIAEAGSLTPDPIGDDGYYANDEAELQLAISQILDDAIKTEVCNGLDDDCDTIADEGFAVGGTCSNNRLGTCRVLGHTECRVDGAGTQCDAGREPECMNAANGTACTVTNADNVPVAGTCQNSVCQPTAAGTPGDPNNEVPFGCNDIDDDCDGVVDENVTGCECIPTGEICDGDDDDCDGLVDEGTDVPCGTGTCQGFQRCVGGVLQACDAPPALPETCNGLDDNCDGNADGLTADCSNLDNGYPAMDPRNNPGASGHSPMTGCEALGPQCICNPGTRTCPLNGSGTWSACTGEVTPQLEICNNLDDDCDGLVDEAPPVACTTSADCASTPLTPTCDNPHSTQGGGTCVPADCSSNCGVGQLVCVNGAQQCNATPAMSDDSCDGNDDDCDGQIDEDWQCQDPDGPDDIPGTPDDCPCSAPGQCGGVEQCQNGAVVCNGEPVGQESCNCEDDDCDGEIDEGSLCGEGATCTNCQCAFQCIPGEFACPVGKICVDNFCLADPCFGVTCPEVPGDKQICRPQMGNPSAHECVSACTDVACSPGQICYLPEGQCRPDNCLTFPERCEDDENCIAGTCVENTCLGVTCPDGQYCIDGQCVNSCAGVDCPAGQRCRLGVCEDIPCDPPCPTGEFCQDDGRCLSDPCRFVVCPEGRWCNPHNNGMCEDDPCAIYEIQCAEGESCRGGTCDDWKVTLPDAGVEEHVTTGGGGGCSTGGDASGSLALGLGILLLVRRRRAGGAS